MTKSICCLLLPFLFAACDSPVSDAQSPPEDSTLLRARWEASEGLNQLRSFTRDVFVHLNGSVGEFEEDLDASLEAQGFQLLARRINGDSSVIATSADSEVVLQDKSLLPDIVFTVRFSASPLLETALDSTIDATRRLSAGNQVSPRSISYLSSPTALRSFQMITLTDADGDNHIATPMNSAARVRKVIANGTRRIAGQHPITTWSYVIEDSTEILLSPGDDGRFATPADNRLHQVNRLLKLPRSEVVGMVANAASGFGPGSRTTATIRIHAKDSTDALLNATLGWSGGGPVLLSVMGTIDLGERGAGRIRSEASSDSAKWTVETSSDTLDLKFQGNEIALDQPEIFSGEVRSTSFVNSTWNWHHVHYAPDDSRTFISFESQGRYRMRCTAPDGRGEDFDGQARHLLGLITEETITIDRYQQE